MVKWTIGLVVVLAWGGGAEVGAIPASSRGGWDFLWRGFVQSAAAGELVVDQEAGRRLEWVRLNSAGTGFQLTASGRAFHPWGLNYDHDRDGRLIEDYWAREWESIEEDFAEMKDMGANVVRVHLQFGRMMRDIEHPRVEAVSRLRKLIALAERRGLYLNLTGLGCYHRADVPAWYDQLDEAQRWRAQAAFWEVVAECGAESPAIFCYDLMNEPVVPGGDQARDDWLGPAFGDKHFVQFITLDRKGRERSLIARQWIEQLVAAIRKHDTRHLVTVGMVPWSLDRPGLTSGFAPDRVSESLDFVSVHLYPETGKLEEALATLRGFAAAGKPVVIEETFPLRCDAETLGTFLERSREDAVGWVGFYWGETPAELSPPATIAEAMTKGWLELFRDLGPRFTGRE